MSRFRRHTATAALATSSLASIYAVPIFAQVPTAEYTARRDSLAARLGDGVVVAFGGRTPVTDVGPFYQLPAFHYLTSFDEPDAAMVLVAKGGKASTTLFLSPIDPRTAFYYGRRPDSASVERTLGVTARAYSALTSFVDSVATASPKTTFYTLADFGDADFAQQDSLTRGKSFVKSLSAKHPGLTVKDAHDIVDQLRARKSPAELALLRKAGEISAEGHRAAMLAPEPAHEYEVQAVVEYTFTRLGGERPAYGSIVGAGANGTQLHYMKDRNPAKPGDLIVIDAATQYEGYAADVTRTIPVSGSYTADQRKLYQLVRDAQAAAERNSKPGMSAKAASDSSVAVRAKGLVALGLAESETALEGELFRRPGRVQPDVLLDDPWPGPRHRARRARPGAVLLRRSHLQGRRRVHDRARHLREPGDARRAAGYAEEPRVQGQGEGRRGALPEHGRAHRGQLRHHRQGARADLEQRAARDR